MSTACNCMTRVRLSLVTKIDGRQYPASTHFEDCHKHVKERFVRVELDGSACVMTPAEAEELKASAGEHDYTFSDVYLTADQFRAMPEFQGF